jgi:acyl-coenzyme A synthetase/AMP-(fatty) acid ligase
VRDVAIVAVPGGEAPEICAAVVLAPGTDTTLLLAQVKATLGADAPTRLVALDRLPRNDNGKVLRRQLAALLQPGGRPS